MYNIVICVVDIDFYTLLLLLLLGILLRLTRAAFADLSATYKDSKPNIITSKNGHMFLSSAVSEFHNTKYA